MYFPFQGPGGCRRHPCSARDDSAPAPPAPTQAAELKRQAGAALRLPAGVELLADSKPEYETILTKDALAFVAMLARKHGAR